MGKNGAAMRAAKLQKTTYTFTREQLFEHDKQVSKAALEKYHKRVEEEVGDILAKSSEDDTMRTLQFLLAMCCKVLIEEFHWKSLPKERKEHPHSKIVRFAQAVASEIDNWKQDDARYVEEYCEKIYDLYGVKFDWG